MCGISGIITNDPSIGKHDLITEMNSLISHRGPDAEGVFVEPGFAFGHRRLSILDLSEGGYQPMTYQGCTITYNGEIYNYVEIKQELIKLGHRFTNDTDTEVILAAYLQWGEACVERFNGMWSFAIYDPKKNIIFCSRDRFGVKPFYYSKKSGSFLFGSEIKQLLIFFDRKKANKKIVMDYLVTGFLEHTDETFFEGVYKLPQGHNLIYSLSCSSFEIKKYYDLYEKTNLGDEVFTEEKLYEKELVRSIKIRFRSDVKVGACLSGGMDSSTICALSSELLGSNKLTAIHAKSTEGATDESYFAKKVADHCDLDLKIVEPTVDEFLSHIDDVVSCQEEPFGGPSIFMQYFVMRKARQLGCIVMLDGQAGDETLLGYERYYPTAFFDVFKHDGIGVAFNTFLKSFKNNYNISIPKFFVYAIGGKFSSLRKRVYLRKCFFLKGGLHSNFKHLDDISNCFFSIKKLQALELMSTNLPELLRYEDKNSMANSVEARLPYVDFKVVENAIRIPTIDKVGNGWTKKVLRCVAGKILPDVVVWRKDKLGFNAPDSSWMTAANDVVFSEINNSEFLDFFVKKDKLLKGFEKLDSRVKWRLFNLAVWGRIYNVRCS